MWGLYTTPRSSLLVSHEINTCKLIACLQSYWKIPEFLGRLDLFIFCILCRDHHCWYVLYILLSSWESQTTIELDWIEEYQWVALPRLSETVSGKGWIQKRSHFSLDMLFSPCRCTNVIRIKARWQPPDFVTSLLIGSQRSSFTPLFRFSSMPTTFSDFPIRVKN